jgi:hypothetical protein
MVHFDGIARIDGLGPSIGCGLPCAGSAIRFEISHHISPLI